MANLKIKATADVASAKASIKELTAEDANLLAKQKEANLVRRQDAARTAQEQVKQAKLAGTATRQEMGELRRLERIATADARVAAREVSQAKREAGRATAQAEKQALQEQLRLERETSNLRRLADAEQRASTAAAAVGRQRAFDIDMGYKVAAIKDRSRQDAKLLGGIADNAVDGGGGGGSRSTRQVLGAAGRFAGPAAGAALLVVIAETLKAMLEEQRAARKESIDKVDDAGKAQNKLAEKMRESGMKDPDIARVLAMTEGLGGTKSTSELANVAIDALEPGGSLEAGAATPEALIKAMRKAAVGQPEQTAAQRLANNRARMKRQAEIANQGIVQSTGGAQLDEDAAALERALQYADGGSTVVGRMVGAIPRIFSERAGLETENWVNSMTMFGPAHDRKTINVRIIADQTRHRPLGGE